jgi:hypothetical protein
MDTDTESYAGDFFSTIDADPEFQPRVPRVLKKLTPWEQRCYAFVGGVKRLIEGGDFLAAYNEIKKSKNFEYELARSTRFWLDAYKAGNDNDKKIIKNIVILLYWDREIKGKYAKIYLKELRDLCGITPELFYCRSFYEKLLNGYYDSWM